MQSKLAAEGIEYQESKEYQKYGIRGIPAMVVTDGEGNLLGRIGGLASLHRQGKLAESVCKQATSHW